jgi:hypothetical protein
MNDPRPGNEQRDGSGSPIEAYQAEARSLSPSEFEDRHGAGFLLLSTAGLQVPSGPSMTEVRLDDGDETGGECTADVSVLVYPLRRGAQSVGHLITLGRTSNNDVVVPDLSVSRFHAFVKAGTGGPLQLQDANSTNGTTVNGRSIPAQGQGPAADLKSGDSVRLGQVEFTFVDATAMREFALAHEG